MIVTRFVFFWKFIAFYVLVRIRRLYICLLYLYYPCVFNFISYLFTLKGPFQDLYPSLTDRLTLRNVVFILLSKFVAYPARTELSEFVAREACRSVNIGLVIDCSTAWWHCFIVFSHLYPLLPLSMDFHHI